MGRDRHGDNADCERAPPVLVTEWGDFTVSGGVLFVAYRSGPDWHTIAMGPAMAFEAIDRARKALARGLVERLVGPPTH